MAQARISPAETARKAAIQVYPILAYPGWSAPKGARRTANVRAGFDALAGNATAEGVDLLREPAGHHLARVVALVCSDSSGMGHLTRATLTDCSPAMLDCWLRARLSLLADAASRARLGDCLGHSKSCESPTRAAIGALKQVARPGCARLRGGAIVSICTLRSSSASLIGEMTDVTVAFSLRSAVLGARKSRGSCFCSVAG